jgi:DNA-binding transcriptional regulator YiaG
MPITPNQLKKLRRELGLTQTDAAKIIHGTLRGWQGHEAPEGTAAHRAMSECALELFCIKTKTKYPIHR